MLPEHCPLPCEVDNDVADPGRDERFDVVLNEWFTAGRQQRLRRVICKRAHALTAPCRQNHCFHAFSALDGIAASRTGMTRVSMSVRKALNSGYEPAATR